MLGKRQIHKASDRPLLSAFYDAKDDESSMPLSDARAAMPTSS